MLARGLPLGWGKDAKRFDGVITITSCVGEAVSMQLTGFGQAVHVFRALVCCCAAQSFCAVLWGGLIFVTLLWGGDVLILCCFPPQRVLRLLRTLVPFRPILRTFAITLKTCFPILGILLCIMYFFAVLGIEFFGGQLTPDRVPPTSVYVKAL